MRTLFALLITAGLALVGIAAQQVVFEDKAENMRLEGLTSWRVQRLDAKRLRFEGAGRPFVGSWRDQGLRIKGNRIDGEARRGQGGALALSKADVTGSVQGTLTRTAPDGVTRTTELTSPRLTYNADTNRVAVTGGAVVTSRTSDGMSQSRLSGASATLDLNDPKASPSWPIAQGVVQGPVTVTFERLDRSAAGPARRVTLRATCDRVEFNDAERTLKLIGNVKLDGDDELTGGSVRGVSLATIRLTAKREIDEIVFEGAPGVTTYQERTTGGS